MPPYKTKETYTIIESFNWMAAPDFKIVDTGKNTVTITGIAVRKNQVSKNNRKYVEEELQAAARTFINKPVTINHAPYKKSHPMYDGRLVPGNIRWMEYEPSVGMRFQADIKKQPYVDMLRNHSVEIKGVSIEADYIANRCNTCGKDFYSIDEFTDHMTTVEKIKNFNYEPRGMMGKAMSIVLSPEEPGVSGTTIDLREKYQRPQTQGFSQLLEMVIKNRKEQEKMTTKPKVPYKLKEQTDPLPEPKDEHGCIKDKEKWDGEKCVPIVAKSLEQIEPAIAIPGLTPPSEGDPEKLSCPDGFHLETNNEGKQSCVSDTPPPIIDNPTALEITGETPVDPNPPSQFPHQDNLAPCPTEQHRDKLTGLCVSNDLPIDRPPIALEAIKLPTTLKLGEPFAGFDNMQQCIDQNSDKEDPAAHCAAIMKKTEGEPTTETKQSKDIYETQQNLHKHVKNVDTQGILRDAKIAESVNALNKACATTFLNLNKVSDHVDEIANKTLTTLQKHIKTVESAAQVNLLSATEQSKIAYQKLGEYTNSELNKVIAEKNKTTKQFREATSKLATTLKHEQKQNKIIFEKLATAIAKTKQAIPKADPKIAKQLTALKNQLEATRTLATAQLTEQKNQLEATRTLATAQLTEQKNQLEETKKQSTEHLETFRQELSETKQLATEQKKDFEHILAAADTTVTGLKETVKTLEDWKQSKEQELKETDTKTKDREAFASALKEAVTPIATKLENLEHKIKGNMKQTHTPQEHEDLDPEALPYDEK